MFLLLCDYHVLNTTSHIIFKFTLSNVDIEKISIWDGLMIHWWGK